MSTAESVAKMNILSLASTSLGTTGTTEIPIGAAGAAFAMKVPEWATYLRGIWVNVQTTALTDNQTAGAWGRLDTNDGLAIKPFIFLFPPLGTNGTTPGQGNATKSEFYPVNAPVVAGSNIQAFASKLMALTAACYAWVDFVFSNDLAQNPSKLDPMPNVQRYRVIGTRTGTVAAGRAVGTAYNFNAGTAVTEIGGNLDAGTADVANMPGVGYATFESNDIPLWPAYMHFDAFGSLLATGCHLAPEGVTRRPVMAPCERVVTIQDYFTSGAALVHTTGFWTTCIEFIR